MEKGGPASASIDLKRDGMEDLSGRVHQLPCCVKHDGPAAVSQYFKPKPTGVGEEGSPLQQAHFRGRLLQGTTLHLPRGYSGFVLGKKSSPEENSPSWETNATFHDITYWNHDYVPSHNDDFFRAFHWLTISKPSLSIEGGAANLQYACPSESDLWRQKNEEELRDYLDDDRFLEEYSNPVLDDGRSINGQSRKAVIEGVGKRFKERVVADHEGSDCGSSSD